MGHLGTTLRLGLFMLVCWHLFVLTFGPQYSTAKHMLSYTPSFPGPVPAPQVESTIHCLVSNLTFPPSSYLAECFLAADTLYRSRRNATPVVHIPSIISRPSHPWRQRRVDTRATPRNSGPMLSQCFLVLVFGLPIRQRISMA